MDDEQAGTGMVLVRSSFPVTGQPVRVVMIDGEPWFVTADVCRILGRGNPSDAVKVLEPHQHRTIDLRTVTLVRNKGYRISAGQKPYRQGNPLIGVVSEAGLYGLLMRSDKSSARSFRAWVAEDLLPSVRRGDTDVPAQQRRMAETLGEAIGRQVYVVAEIEHEDWPGLVVRSDGTVHCRHGEMLLRLPGAEDDSGPPFGAHFACPGGERVGIRGSRVVPGCPRLGLADLIRLRGPVRTEPVIAPQPDQGLMYAEVDRGRINRVHGSPSQIAELMREHGQ
ncbi:BRO-N domain-containing protein [Kitasatospora sp. NBC_00458]|uniref:BRO-N domain-containing protein n=1 Tax=Kitasatospora sp. NBC_00458 TaxID=2903568 RepID=UPI002E197632